ncbi:histidine phosphatase family protein [Mycobacterium paraterrae]|uniref:histidine phosphatase family protein n=1 Tax=Mycobacterium paraterrae TaxID=577492 RepID=UPI003D9CAF02
MAARIFGVCVTALLEIGISPLAGADDSHSVTLTLVRHAESTANAAGVIDTSTPGPGLSSRGECQAAQAAGPLSAHHYDGVYASNMIRTQQTAAPTAQALGEGTEFLPGLGEIEAGTYEGHPGADVSAYLAAPTSWVHGDRAARIPDSLDGNEFEARFNSAVQRIYDSGHTNPVAFSHSAAIMAWTLMNTRNSDPALMTTRPLPNLGRVVVIGSPKQGWTLTEWDADSASC